jgi:hypothetical protein
MCKTLLPLTLIALLLGCGDTYGDPTFHWMAQHQGEPLSGSADLVVGGSMSGWLTSGMMEASFWWHDSQVTVTDVKVDVAPAGIVDAVQGHTETDWTVVAKAPGTATVTFRGKVDGKAASSVAVVRVDTPATVDVEVPGHGRPEAVIAGGTYAFDVVAKDAGGRRLLTAGWVPPFLAGARPTQDPLELGTVYFTATAPIALPDGSTLDVVEAPDALGFRPNGVLEDWARGQGWIGVRMLSQGREVPFPTHGWIGTAKLTLLSEGCGFNACITCDTVSDERELLVTLPHIKVGRLDAETDESCEMQIEASVGNSQWTLPLTVPLKELPLYGPPPVAAPVPAAVPTPVAAPAP